MRLNWTKYCLLSAGDNESDDDVNTDNVIFTIKEIKLYLLLVTLSAKVNENVLHSLSKGFERLFFCNDLEQKVRIKIQHMTPDFFSNQIL